MRLQDSSLLHTALYIDEGTPLAEAKGVHTKYICLGSIA